MRKIGKKDNKQLREHQFKILAGVLACANNENEAASVFNTILTTSEKMAIAQRIAIVKRIKEGKAYYEIEGDFGVSPNTICKAVDLYLKNGADNHVFNKVLERFDEPQFKYIVPKSSDKSTEMVVGYRSLQRQQNRNKLS